MRRSAARARGAVAAWSRAFEHCPHHCLHAIAIHMPVCTAVSLRLQLTDTKEYKDRSPYQAFAEYILCCVVLFLAVLNFMG
jgi:hypothetical protein